MTVLAQILERYDRYGWSEPAGEWGVIQAEYRTEMRTALDAHDSEALECVLAGMFRGPMAYGLVSAPDDIEKTLPMELTWRLALWAKVTDSRDVERLRAPTVGRPLIIGVTPLDGDPVPVMPDAMRFDCYARRIWNTITSLACRHVPTDGVVLEIGSGYGGVALQLLRCPGSIQTLLCDIPETLYLAHYWLAHATDHKVAWWDDDPDASVVLIPDFDLERANVHPDLVFSAHSFSGMDRATIDGYMKWLEGSGARYFYHDDATEKVDGVWMTTEIPEILDIKPPARYREVWRESTPWTGLRDRFCEVFYEHG